MHRTTIRPIKLINCAPSTPFVAVTSCKPPRLRFLRVQSVLKKEPEVVDVSFGLVAKYSTFFRSLPLWGGGFGISFVILNRLVSGIAPVVDASSSQSRTDVLAIVLSAVLLLCGLQWLSLKPKPPQQVELEGGTTRYLDPSLKLAAAVTDEMNWAWSSLSANSRCKALVIIYKGRNIFHVGAIKPGVKPGSAVGGDICRQAMESGTGNYLANLVLYPGRLEFTTFLPENTQAVVVQPIGKEGVMVAATDTLRGFTGVDQAWIALIADKLENSLESVKLSQPGAGFAASKAKSKAPRS